MLLTGFHSTRESFGGIFATFLQKQDDTFFFTENTDGFLAKPAQRCCLGDGAARLSIACKHPANHQTLPCTYAK